jgi:hypothetical protein
MGGSQIVNTKIVKNDLPKESTSNSIEIHECSNLNEDGDAVEEHHLQFIKRKDFKSST